MSVNPYWFADNFSERVIVAEKPMSNAEKALKALEMLEANEKKSDVLVLKGAMAV